MNQQLALIENQTASASKAITFFESFSTELEVIKKANADFVFDYTDKKQRDSAKSHIYKLRQSKAAIEKAGKAERASSVAYQKAVIAEEDKLVAVVVEMIEHHDKPLREWEEKENQRVAEIHDRLKAMQVSPESLVWLKSDELKKRWSELEAIDTASFAEFSDQAFATRVMGLEVIKAAIITAEKAEADARELEQLRAASEARRIADEEAAEAKRLEDERIAKEKADAHAAAELARIATEAEEKRKADAIAEAARIAAAEKKAADDARAAAEVEAAQREAKLLQDAENARIAQKSAEDKAESDRVAAEEQRKRAAEQARLNQEAAVAAETKRIADAAAAQKAVDDARAANREHRAKINRETMAALTEVIGTAIAPEDQAKMVITAVALGKIPHLQINY